MSAAVGTLTVTGKVGPGNTLTSSVIKNLTNIDFDIANARLIFIQQFGPPQFIDIAAATTITITLPAAAGNYTITVS